MTEAVDCGVTEGECCGCDEVKEDEEVVMLPIPLRSCFCAAATGHPDRLEYEFCRN